MEKTTRKIQLPSITDRAFSNNLPHPKKKPPKKRHLPSTFSVPVLFPREKVRRDASPARSGILSARRVSSHTTDGKNGGHVHVSFRYGLRAGDEREGVRSSQWCVITHTQTRLCPPCCGMRPDCMPKPFCLRFLSILPR